MMKVAYLAFAASAVLASPIEPVVDAKKPADVCHAAPYKQWLSLSELPAATDYCHKNFPKKTPTCHKAVTITPKPTTEKYTVTQTTTDVDATILTMTTGQPNIITITATASPSITFVSSTATAPTTTVTSCSMSSTSGNSSMPELGNSTAAINRRQLANGPVDLAKKQGTKTKSTPKAKKSLQARFKSLKKLDKKAKATKICHCIESAPACTKKTKTAPQSTATETVYQTVGIVANPVTTIMVPDTRTLTHTEFVPATTTATVILNAGTITPTAYVGCNNATATGSA